MKYDELFYDSLEKHVCFIEFGKQTGKKRLVPYTQCRSYLGGNSNKPWNLLTGNMEDINVGDIYNYTYYNEDKEENERNKLSKDFVNQMKGDLENCSTEFIKKEKIEELLHDLYLLGEYELKNNNLFLFFKEFDFSFTLEDVSNNIITNKEITLKCYIKILQKEIDKNTLELKSLKDECEDEDDLEDIESIIEMFESITDEITDEFEDITKLTELKDIYPPLLNPLPGSLSDIQSYVKKYETGDFLDNWTDLESLKAYLDEINSFKFEDYEEFDINLVNFGKKRIEDKILQLENLGNEEL
jgi:hypothetical protein